MPRKSFRPEEIIAKLREADVLLGQGKRVAEVAKPLGVSEVKLRDELRDREVFHSLREAQVLLEAWRRHLYEVASVKGGSGTLGSSLVGPDRLSASGPSFDMRRQTHPLVSGRGREPRTTISFTATEHASAGAGPNYNSVLKAP